MNVPDFFSRGESPLNQRVFYRQSVKTRQNTGARHVGVTVAFYKRD